MNSKLKSTFVRKNFFTLKESPLCVFNTNDNKKIQLMLKKIMCILIYWKTENLGLQKWSLDVIVHKSYRAHEIKRMIDFFLLGTQTQELRKKCNSERFFSR